MVAGPVRSGTRLSVGLSSVDEAKDGCARTGPGGGGDWGDCRDDEGDVADCVRLTQGRGGGLNVGRSKAVRGFVLSADILPTIAAN